MRNVFGLLRFLGVVVLSAGWLPAQVTLIPDFPRVLTPAAAVTATPRSDGKIALAVGSVTGTVEVVLPPLPAGTSDSGTVQFPQRLNVQLRQSWSDGTATISIEQTAIGRCSTRLNGECPLNFMETETTDARRAFVDVRIQTDVGFHVVVVRFRWRINTPAVTPVDIEPAIEVVQAVQTEAGDVPLISGKDTVVRVLARQLGDNPASGIRGRLNIWKLDGSTRTLQIGPKDYEAPGGISAYKKIERTAALASLDFRIPADWISSVGFYELRAELILPPSLSAVRPEKLVISQTVGFRPSPSLRILWFPVNYPDAEGKLKFPSADVNLYEPYLKAIFPIASANLRYSSVPMRLFAEPGQETGAGFDINFRLNDPEDATELIGEEKMTAAIYELMQADGVPDHDQAIAFLPNVAKEDTKDSKGAITWASADPRFLGGKGKAVWQIVDRDNILRGQNDLSHEIAHNLQQQHTNLSPPNCTLAPSKEPLWPYADGTVQEPGFDTFGRRFIPPTHFDLMNYCDAAVSWISPIRYIRIRDELEALNSRPAPNSQIQSNLRSATATSAFLIVSGVVATDGSNARLNYTMRAQQGPASQPDPDGKFCIRQTGDPEPPPDFCFNTRSMTVETERPIRASAFSLKIPFAESTTRIVLLSRAPDGERELAAWNAASGPPSLEITSPRPDDRLQGTATLSWSATDPSGLPLQYRIQFSNDGGATWYPMSILPLSASQFRIDTTELAGASNVYFRVFALNGFHTTVATVGPITLVQSPRLTLANPTLDFGQIPRGVPATKPIELRNPGTGPFVINTLTSDNNLVRVSSTLPIYVWPGDTPTTIPVDILPVTAGAFEANLTINGNTRIRVTAQATDSTSAGTGSGGSGGTGGTGGTGGSGGSGTTQPDLVKISPLTARGWPNERNFDNPPANAVDGNINTFTWTTNPNNTVLPSYFGVDFGASKAVSRIRLYKDNDGGGGTLSDFFKNLTIEYTTTAVTTPLANRTWTRVTNLANGYNGAERLTATAVNADGTVTRDSHKSATDGWASLTFTPVNATGIRIAFSNTTNPNFFNHYKVHEFEAYGPASGVGTGTGSGSAGGSTTTATCPSTTNIALGKAATQSSTAFGGSASAGNNGILEPDYGFHTDEEINPWWQVDLGQSSTVCSMRLFNRVTAEFQARARSIAVLASDDGATFRTIYTHDNSVWGANSAPLLPNIQPFAARYVRLRLQANQFLYFNLREVEIYGFPGVNPGTGSGTGSGAGGATTSTDTAKITPLTAQGWPNGRTFDNPPPNAVDGNTNTFTWTTNPNNTALPSYFGVDFGSSKTVSRIRLFKDNDGGGGTLSDHFKNLVIEYTTSPASTPLANRTWTRVTNLANGFNGIERLTVTAVNSDGSVTRDSHNSATSGWASLTFTPVAATGVRIAFSNVTSSTFYNHYKVHEFEAYGPSSGTTTTTTTRVLQIDDGTVETTSGFDEGGVQGYFLNRLTPTTYPATLRKVMIQFPAAGQPLNGLPLATAIQLLSGATTTSGPQLTGVSVTRTNATVSAFNTFVEYDVPPITIQSGSFLVGFSVLNPPNVYPIAVDTNTTAQRSYVSADGSTYFLYDTIPGIRPGNFLIRARVE